MDEDIYDHECDACGGPCGVMGQLGDVVHSLCRDCGMWHQQDAAEFEQGREVEVE